MRGLPTTAVRTAALTALTALAAAGSPVAAHPRTGAQHLGDPDYGVCRGTDPSCYHDWGNFDPAVDGYKVLLYTRTAGPRHADLGPALGPGLDPPLTAANVVQNAIVALGSANGFGTEYNFPWYEGLLGGANFYDHGPLQPATINLVNTRDASTTNLPGTWA